MKILNKKRTPETNPTAELYASVTSQARQYIFFKDYQVPDTPQGRFEMLALHMALMLRRLKFLWPDEGELYANTSQDLIDWVVADIEESIRAMRVSDLKITRHLKTFVEGFYGRLVAYDKALEINDKDMLEEAIRRNVYGIVDKVEDHIVEGLVAYTCQTWEWLEETSIPQIIIDLKGE
jgi:cytochrome b pre-mRNA-processing protein 3